MNSFEQVLKKINESSIEFIEVEGCKKVVVNGVMFDYSNPDDLIELFINGGNV